MATLIDTEGGMTHPMTDKNWTVMNDLNDAFNQIVGLEFLLEQLQEAVDSGKTERIVNASHAANAFIAVYTQNWDEKFQEAWSHVVKPVEEEEDTTQTFLPSADGKWCLYKSTPANNTTI